MNEYQSQVARLAQIGAMADEMDVPPPEAVELDNQIAEKQAEMAAMQDPAVVPSTATATTEPPIDAMDAGADPVPTDVAMPSPAQMSAVDAKEQAFAAAARLGREIHHPAEIPHYARAFTKLQMRDQRARELAENPEAFNTNLANDLDALIHNQALEAVGDPVPTNVGQQVEAHPHVAAPAVDASDPAALRDEQAGFNAARKSEVPSENPSPEVPSAPAPARARSSSGATSDGGAGATPAPATRKQNTQSAPPAKSEKPAKPTKRDTVKAKTASVDTSGMASGAMAGASGRSNDVRYAAAKAQNDRNAASVNQAHREGNTFVYGDGRRVPMPASAGIDEAQAQVPNPFLGAGIAAGTRAAMGGVAGLAESAAGKAAANSIARGAGRMLGRVGDAVSRRLPGVVQAVEPMAEVVEQRALPAAAEAARKALPAAGQSVAGRAAATAAAKAGSKAALRVAAKKAEQAAERFAKENPYRRMR